MDDTDPTCDCCGDEAEVTCYCPLSGIVDVLARKYAMQLVSVVGAHGRMRFGEIEDHIGPASTATLSNRLDELAAAGLLDRTQYDEIPPRVEYELTDEGRELEERLQPVLQWADAREGEVTA